MEKFKINQQESKTVIPSPCHVKLAPALYYLNSLILSVALSSSIFRFLIRGDLIFWYLKKCKIDVVLMIFSMISKVNTLLEITIRNLIANEGDFIEVINFI